MKPLLLFRPTGTVIHTTHAPTRLFVVLALLFVVGLYGTAQMLDDTPPPERHAEDTAAAIKNAFAMGRAKGQAEMIDSAKAAWQSAQLEADRCRVAKGHP
jgi:hypothetical protein